MQTISLRTAEQGLAILKRFIKQEQHVDDSAQGPGHRMPWALACHLRRLMSGSVMSRQVCDLIKSIKSKR